MRLFVGDEEGGEKEEEEAAVEVLVAKMEEMRSLFK